MADLDLDAALAASRARGEPVALATVTAGPGAGSRMLIWKAGHARGSLGQPRLNQRASLYAEALLDKGKFPPRSRKSFDLHGGAAEVEFEFFAGR
jgi:xanthine/CO dehydrogenase XdhC/CoxF family maturation factor